jgi:hypothetical protein
LSVSVRRLFPVFWHILFDMPVLCADASFAVPCCAAALCSDLFVCGVHCTARPSVSPVLYRQQAQRLVFKRRLYCDLTSEDKLAQQLLYYQTLVSICDDSLPIPERQLLKILALHRLIDERAKPQPIGSLNMLAKVAVQNILPSSAEAGYNEKKKDILFEKIAKVKAELVLQVKNRTPPCAAARAQRRALHDPFLTALTNNLSPVCALSGGVQRNTWM